MKRRDVKSTHPTVIAARRAPERARILGSAWFLGREPPNLEPSAGRLFNIRKGMGAKGRRESVTPMAEGVHK
jgi:hypothetical protein